jgi:hypothetical protein
MGEGKLGEGLARLVPRNEPRDKIWETFRVSPGFLGKTGNLGTGNLGTDRKPGKPGDRRDVSQFIATAVPFRETGQI